MLFAKQPIAGQVKTRLQGRYTPEEAAEIAAFLVAQTVELAVASWPGAIYLLCAPDIEHPLFRDLAGRFDIALTTQGEGDLGARMQRAIAYGTERHGTAARNLGLPTKRAPDATTSCA